MRDDVPQQSLRSLATLIAVLGLVLTATAPAAAAQHTDDGAFVVDLAVDGSATVTVHLAYDLDSDEEQTAFRDLEESDTLQEQYRTDFRDRMSRVAATAANETGREMRVSDPQVAFETRDSGSTGVVSLSVEWTGVAATTDDGVVVTEPFATSFEPDRRFVLQAPDGYVLTDVSPAADARNANSAEWETGASLEGFRAAFESSSTPTETSIATTTPTGSGTGTPGFGVVVAVSALVAAALLFRR